MNGKIAGFLVEGACLLNVWQCLACATDVSCRAQHIPFENSSAKIVRTEFMLCIQITLFYLCISDFLSAPYFISWRIPVELLETTKASETIMSPEDFARAKTCQNHLNFFFVKEKCIVHIGLVYNLRLRSILFGLVWLNNYKAKQQILPLFKQMA